jgi:hypothetical protein
LENGELTEELFHVKYGDGDEEDMGRARSSLSRSACGGSVIKHEKDLHELA